ncbi:ATP-grasp domain-containing protein [Hansschlegelia quercus]|uniref:ATP-grasp domain-containing protein n=2 Tax=Hansschlegelia quercus TaxID=2528245 RepID=A0A4Q9GK95_9HYPH|nr:ATP-grasp domain-containing protein [Hansschlegelia quercus]
MMRDALARDLSDLPGVSLITTHDARFSPPKGVASVSVTPGRDPWRLWAYCAEKCQVAWVVAPETDGLLRRLTEICLESDAMVVGPDIRSIMTTSSKKLTSDALIAAGVPALPTWTGDDLPAGVSGRFVVKPDDGAGCIETRLVEGPLGPGTLKPGDVVQPFAEGDAASLTVLCSRSQTTLLAANRQHVTIVDGAFRFGGLTVGALPDRDGALTTLADRVAKAIPGLEGIFGIDLVITRQGPVVVEVNPRVTTSYAGLREAIGLNPATLVAPFAARPDRRLRNVSTGGRVEITL